MNQLPEDDMLRSFWQDGKKEAPEGFSDFVMHHLPQHTPLPEALKKPLLSPQIGAALTGLLVLLGILLNRLGGGSSAALTPWQQNMVDWLWNSAGWLSTNDAVLPIVGAISVAIILLIGLDRLLKRYLHRTTHE